jgi:hypothetical protein
MMLAAAWDLLLALVCVGAIAVRIRGAPCEGRAAMLAGWSVLALAACVGTLRYAGWIELAHLHRLLSDVAAGFGLPAVVLGLLLGWRATGARADRVLLTTLAAVWLGAMLADQPRLPGMVLTVLAAITTVALAPRRARAASLLGLIALLSGAAFASRLPHESAIAGLHVALAVAQLGWCRAALTADGRAEKWKNRSPQTA